MYLLGSLGGIAYQGALWRLRRDGRLVLHDLTKDEVDRMAALMEKYTDTPMDLADASLVVAAETRSITTIFSIDSDFLVYRLRSGRAFDIVP